MKNSKPIIRMVASVALAVQAGGCASYISAGYSSPAEAERFEFQRRVESLRLKRPRSYGTARYEMEAERAADRRLVNSLRITRDTRTIYAYDPRQRELNKYRRLVRSLRLDRRYR